MKANSCDAGLISVPHEFGALIPLRRRGLLAAGAAAGLLAPFGVPAQRARAAEELTAPALVQSRPKVTLIWGPSALCLVPIAVAQRQRIFEKHGLEVETLNVGYDTTVQVEAIALGKADATATFLMRLFKPLEAGFDMKMTFRPAWRLLHPGRLARRWYRDIAGSAGQAHRHDRPDQPDEAAV